METKEIKKNIEKIESSMFYLEKINDESEELYIELRVFTKGGWNTIDFNPENESTKNMVIQQLRIELENEIKKAKQNIKKLTNI